MFMEAKAIALHQKQLDSQLWHACAGGMVQMPRVDSKVFYFPQGHVEHAQASVDFGSLQIPSFIACKVSSVKFMADLETDEVFAKIRLIPLIDRNAILVDDDFDGCNGGLFVGSNCVESNDQRLASFAKTLTQSDANNGGGFSVPRYCAETIFPRLDYSAEPPVQNILAKDVHGVVWKFRHIYRGTPRRHLLTTGWSNFVNQKKLVAGDSIVFLREENGDIRVGVRRAKRGIGDGVGDAFGWNSYGGCTGFMREEENKLTRRTTNGDVKDKVSVASVFEAATLAAKGQPFEVIYYPRGSSPEFVVKASAVKAAMQIQWCPGMRFKMAFDTEDSSRISWFMGSVSSVQVADPIHWPNSLWRLLQVAWDEPDLLQNVKRVSPWLVELVSNVPTIHMSPFSPLRKKPRFPQAPDFSFIGQLPLPPFPGNPLRLNSPLCGVPDNFPAGIQGARHAQFGLPTVDLNFNKLQPGRLNVGCQQLNHAAPLPRTHSGNVINKGDSKEDMSPFLTLANHSPNPNGSNKRKAPHILLFGHLILADQQNSRSCSRDTNGNNSSNGNPDRTVQFSDGSSSATHQNGLAENSSDEDSPMYKDQPKTHCGVDTSHCQELTGSVEVNRTLNLSNLGSYKGQYGKLLNIFSINSSERLSNVLYQDAAGAINNCGDGLSVNL